MEEIATPKLNQNFIYYLKLINNYSSESHLHDVRNLINQNLPDVSKKVELENSLNKGEYSWNKIKKAKEYDKSTEKHSEEFWMRRL
jgi:hypothetical protein